MWVCRARAVATQDENDVLLFLVGFVFFSETTTRVTKPCVHSAETEVDEQFSCPTPSPKGQSNVACIYESMMEDVPACASVRRN